MTKHFRICLALVSLAAATVGLHTGSYADPLNPFDFSSQASSNGDFAGSGAITANTDTLMLAGSTTGTVFNDYAVFAFNSFALGSGANLTVSGSRPMVILSLTDITIDGSINFGTTGDVVGGPGTGQAGTGSGGGGGGGFGAVGGAGGPSGLSPGGLGGAAYGDLFSALVGGSSGGGAGAGKGGGALELGAADSFSLGSSGSILANGTNGATGSGGGSGGGILIDALAVYLAGAILAQGGLGANGGAPNGGGGGGGAGGRIAIQYSTTLLNSAVLNVSGGVGGPAAGIGGLGGLGTSGTISVRQVAPVPLPAALPLFAGGLGMLGWMARRKRGQSRAAA
jgi:hypothetical protein